MELNIVEALSKSGLNPLQAVEKIQELVKFIPKIKEYLPLWIEWEKTLQLKPGQKAIYSAMPAKDEVILYVFIIGEKTYYEKTAVGSFQEVRVTEIQDQKFKMFGFEKLEQMVSFIPGA